MIKVIALDFDGVIMDSAHEIFFVCRKTLEKMGIKPDESIVDKFKKSRNFLRTAYDLYGVIELFRQGKDLNKTTQKDFDDFVKSHESESRQFYKEFFEMRKKIQDEDYEEWFSLNKLFPGVKDAIEKLSKEFHIVIMSSKDFYSIFTVIQRYDIDVEKDNIFNKDITDDKKEQIKLVTKKFSVNHDNVLFIDDQPENLTPLKRLGVNVALAGWGYNNRDQKEETRELGITVLEKLEDIEKEIKRLDEEKN